PDDGDDLARVDDLGRIRLLVALHEERLTCRPAHQGAVEPDAGQEGADIASDRLPELPVVGLEDDPSGRLRDRLLDHVEQATDVEVAPLTRRVREGPCAPDPDPLPREIADAVDAGRVENRLLLASQELWHSNGAPHTLVGP